MLSRSWPEQPRWIQIRWDKVIRKASSSQLSMRETPVTCRKRQKSISVMAMQSIVQDGLASALNCPSQSRLPHLLMNTPSRDPLLPSGKDITLAYGPNLLLSLPHGPHPPVLPVHYFPPSCIMLPRMTLISYIHPPRLTPIFIHLPLRLTPIYTRPPRLTPSSHSLRPDSDPHYARQFS
jgi:hypothetical protein